MGRQTDYPDNQAPLSSVSTWNDSELLLGLGVWFSQLGIINNG